MILEFENQIAEILKSRFGNDGTKVAPISDDLSSWNKFGAQGCVLVRYISENYAQQTGSTYQRTFRFMILFGGKHFGREKNEGIYKNMEIVRRALTGVQLSAQAGEQTIPRIKLLPESGGFVMEQKGIYWFQLTFTGKDSLILH